MSTNKTENCHLHAWEAGDDFLRTEFNENFAAIDDLLAELPTNKKLRVVTGAYYGKGTNGRTFSLGFQPKAVFITCRSNEYNYYHALLIPGASDENGAITADGFTVSGVLDYRSVNSGSIIGEKMNPFRYIAFYWEG